MKIARKPAIGRIAVFTVLTTLFIMAGPRSALAHARLLRSTPKPDSELTLPPANVELWFNELLDGEFNSISVFSASDTDPKPRKNLAEREARVDDKDRTHLSVGVKPLPSGEYVVEWSVLSLDGHTARGKFNFKIRAGK